MVSCNQDLLALTEDCNSDINPESNTRLLAIGFLCLILDLDLDLTLVLCKFLTWFGIGLAKSEYIGDNLGLGLIKLSKNLSFSLG